MVVVVVSLAVSLVAQEVSFSNSRCKDSNRFGVDDDDDDDDAVRFLV